MAIPSGTRPRTSVSKANRPASLSIRIGSSQVKTTPRRYKRWSRAIVTMSRSPLSRVSTAVDRDSELALVERLRQGNGEAFDEVYAAFNTRVFTFLVRLSRRRDVAEDLLEETWLRLVKHARRLAADTKLGPWLFTVARNLHVSYIRSRMLEDSAATSLIGLWPFSLERSSPFEAVAASELERRIERA